MAQYTLKNIQADHLLEVTFRAIVALFTVTVNVGSGGSVSPGTSQYSAGSDAVFTITPDAGMELDKIMLDGTEVPPDA
jgi:hypothetical protein